MRAIILAGGKGTRLHPYTTVFPKPLMPIGDMPILEVVLRQLKAAGIERVTMAVGHLAELLRAFFNDGARLGLPIDYSMERKPLGTVGPLTMIPDLSATFLMMNGDVLTTLNYADLIADHRRSGAVATIATYARQVKIDFGVIEADKANVLTEYVEKPTLDYQVSMGVYVFEPEVLGYLKPDEYRDFPDLVKTLIADGKKVMTYPFSGYWLDIGRSDDYARAIEEFESRRAEFFTSGDKLIKVPLFDPDLGQEEIDAVSDVIRSKWLTMGDLTKRFESEFAAFCGTRHAVAISNCTAALHVALQCLDIKPGDEVICPSLSFVATANAVLYCGATPVFADVESLDDWNISRRTIEAVITDRTRAIIVLHYAGYPCEMPAIMELARSQGLGVVEDVAHAPGGKLDGIAMGAWGDVGCFSFFSNKNMTTGEGGMLTSNRADVAERAGRIRSHGMTTLTLDRDRGHAFDYDVVELGYNYRMGELNAAVGLCQLRQLNARNSRRRALTERYRSNLSDCEGLGLPFIKARGEVTYHLFPVLLPAGCARQPIMQQMRDAGVQTSIHYRPIDTFTSYRKAGLGPKANLVHTHVIGERVLTLPLFPSMTPEQVDYVSATLKQAMSVTT